VKYHHRTPTYPVSKADVVGLPFPFAEWSWSFQRPTSAPIFLIKGLGPMSLRSCKWILGGSFNFGLNYMAFSNNPLNIIICAWWSYTVILYPLFVNRKFIFIKVDI
jgi:hypothetical protein